MTFIPKHLLSLSTYASLVGASLLVGCAQLTPTGSTLDASSSIDENVAPPALTQSRIPSDTLYALLVAEFAAQRQQFNITLNNYLEQAQYTQDLGITERAAHIANYVGADKAAFESAQQWVHLDPNNADAHNILAKQYMLRGQFLLALAHMQAIFELTGSSHFDYLAVNAHPLSSQDKQALLKEFRVLTQTYPDNAQLWMAIGSLELQLLQFDAAHQAFSLAIQHHPDYAAARLNRARTLHKLKQFAPALADIDLLYEQQPKHKGIGVLRARILISLQRLSEARAAFQALHSLFSEDQTIRLSLGLIQIELDQLEDASITLTPLLLSPTLRSEAHFYLAVIAEKQQDYRAAIKHYLNTGGKQLLAAQMKAARLTLQHSPINDPPITRLDQARQQLARAQQQHPQQQIALLQLEIELLKQNNQTEAAYTLSNQSLERFPDNIKLLYHRALLAEKLDKLDQVETDLRHVIKLKPNNAEAINALGYTLADRTDRLDEAMQLIQQAAQLAPNNPAIMDSLGWLYYRQGQLNKSVKVLQEAFLNFPDHEVAAHLGEVLWKLNRNQEAKKVWQQGLERAPESDIIKRTLKRLNIDSIQ